VSDRTGRLVLAAASVPAGAYALWLLLHSATDQWPALLTWLIGGVVLHDLVLAPVLLAVGLAAHRLPAYLRAPAAVGLVVWGSVTLFAVPVLGRFGALDDNPTLLDRPYLVTWLVGCAVTVLLVGVAGALRSRRGVADA
jgi:hypothetical protein